MKKGAGFMMLGGRSSFGAGGWAGTPIEDILPAVIHPGDGELEPPGGIKFVPSTLGLDSFVLQVGANRAETRTNLGFAAADPGQQPLRRAQGLGAGPGHLARLPMPNP